MKQSVKSPVLAAVASAENPWGVVEIGDGGNLRAHVMQWGPTRGAVKQHATRERWETYAIMRRFHQPAKK